MDERDERKIGKVEIRWAMAGLLAVVFGIFIAQNAGRIRVDFVFFSANVRLIWVFLICGVIGAIIDRLLQKKGLL